MADAGVIADPESVRKLAAALTKYKGEVSNAGKSVQGALNSANWRDGNKSKFEARYRDLQKQIDRFMSGEVDQMIRSLNELARKLDEIKRMRM